MRLLDPDHLSLDRVLNGTLQVLGEAPVETLLPTAINWMGMSDVRVYRADCRYQPGDWVYLPHSDSLAVVESYSEDRHSVQIQPLTWYSPRGSDGERVEMPIGTDEPPRLDVDSHRRAYGFCVPGSCRSKAYDEVCANASDSLLEAGCIEVDGVWLADGEATLLSRLRQTPASPDFVLHWLHRFPDWASIEETDLIQRVMQELGMAGIRSDSGFHLPGDWIELDSDTWGFVERQVVSRDSIETSLRILTWASDRFEVESSTRTSRFSQSRAAWSVKSGTDQFRVARLFEGAIHAATGTTKGKRESPQDVASAGLMPFTGQSIADEAERVDQTLVESVSRADKWQSLEAALAGILAASGDGIAAELGDTMMDWLLQRGPLVDEAAARYDLGDVLFARDHLFMVTALEHAHARAKHIPWDPLCIAGETPSVADLSVITGGSSHRIDTRATLLIEGTWKDLLGAVQTVLGASERFVTLSTGPSAVPVFRLNPDVTDTVEHPPLSVIVRERDRGITFAVEAADTARPAQAGADGEPTKPSGLGLETPVHAVDSIRHLLDPSMDVDAIIQTAMQHGDGYLDHMPQSRLGDIVIWSVMAEEGLNVWRWKAFSRTRDEVIDCLREKWRMAGISADLRARAHKKAAQAHKDGVDNYLPPEAGPYCEQPPLENRSTRHVRSPSELRSCFLLKSGWAFRFPVTERLLKGSELSFPKSLADVWPIGPGLRAAFSSSEFEGHVIWAAHQFDRCTVIRVNRALEASGAHAGDSAFLTLMSAGKFDLTVRNASPEGDPLSILLARVGLDPSDPTVRNRPWPPICRALGGSGTSRSDARYLASGRGDVELVDLIEAVEVRAHEERWPQAWEYMSPLVPEEDWFGLRGNGDDMRIAVGGLRNDELPESLILGDDSLLWIEVHGVEEGRLLISNIEASLSAPSTDKGWVRWYRAQHAARLAALDEGAAGWTIEVTSGAWLLTGRTYDSLVEALETAGHIEPVVGSPRRPQSLGERFEAPTSGWAIQRLVDRACKSGLSSISADPAAGFKVKFGPRVVTSLHLFKILS